MRALAIVGRDHPTNSGVDTFELEGVTVRCAILEVSDPVFDPVAQPDHVLLRTLGFSMNFRDRALVLRMATSDKTEGFYVVGSDFVAEVVAVGVNVTEVAPGDRVIPNCIWPPQPGIAHAGIPSNHASRELQVLSREAVMRVPPEMDLAVAACFSIGGQTSHSIVRRLSLSAGERVLVTAPRSNTSLFVLAALAGLDVEIHGVTGSGRDAERLRDLGVANLVTVNARSGPIAQATGFAGALATGGYHGVADPFSDLYLAQVAPMMAFGARYVTCGFEDQSSSYTGVERPRAQFEGLMGHVMMRNLAILGNCLGTTPDLERAVERHRAGQFPVVMDSVFRDDPAGFLRRTYTSSERFGKVAFLYA
jgi:NADPH:quinone reductase-like Zn-dependent oxidoreductase